MAIQMVVDTDFGETRELYIRINNIDALNNHGSKCSVLFRGYISEAAFEARKGYMWERQIEFVPDVAQNIWEQAYTELKSQMAAPENTLGITNAGAPVTTDVVVDLL
jgi:hypothetical protein